MLEDFDEISYLVYLDNYLSDINLLLFDRLSKRIFMRTIARTYYGMRFQNLSGNIFQWLTVLRYYKLHLSPCSHLQQFH